MRKIKAFLLILAISSSLSFAQEYTVTRTSLQVEDLSVPIGKITIAPGDIINVDEFEMELKLANICFESNRITFPLLVGKDDSAVKYAFPWGDVIINSYYKVIASIDIRNSDIRIGNGLYVGLIAKDISKIIRSFKYDGTKHQTIASSEMIYCAIGKIVFDSEFLYRIDIEFVEGKISRILLRIEEFVP